MTDRTKTICPPIFDLRGIKICTTDNRTEQTAIPQTPNSIYSKCNKSYTTNFKNLKVENIDKLPFYLSCVVWKLGNKWMLK